MAKRGAGNYLTDQNWDQEDEAEEAGCFVPAGKDIIKGRQIKKAKRRGAEESSEGSAETAGAFKGFGGFVSKPGSAPLFSFGLNSSKPLGGLPNGTTSNAAGSAGSVPPKAGLFSLATQKPTEGDTLTKTSTSDSKPLTNGDGKPNNKKYLQQLKSLNEAVTQWIKSHVEKNPYCILTPIFKDYEKYVGDIEKNNPDKATTDGSNTETPKLFSTAGSSQVTSSGGFLPSLGGTKILTDPAKASSAPVFKLGGDMTTSGSSNFSFSTSSNTTSSASTGFSFKSPTNSTEGATKPAFSFAVGPATATAKEGDKKDEEEEYVPPKPEVSSVKEDDAKYSVRCKLFYQKDGNWTERGLGNLHLKPCDDKTQLLVRADTNLGNIILNIMVTPAMPAKRLGKNNVIIVCIPNPPINTKGEDDKKPVQMMIRVKTAEMADELLKNITECKG